jgi:hypothetical protein
MTSLHARTGTLDSTSRERTPSCPALPSNNAHGPPIAFSHPTRCPALGGGLNSGPARLGDCGLGGRRGRLFWVDLSAEELALVSERLLAQCTRVAWDRLGRE